MQKLELITQFTQRLQYGHKREVNMSDQETAQVLSTTNCHAVQTVLQFRIPKGKKYIYPPRIKIAKENANVLKT